MSSLTSGFAWVDTTAEIGLRVRISPGVYVGPRVRIDDDVVLGPGARIGQGGFGYRRDERGRWISKPESCGVVIENGVHIGANTCIDSGSYRDTFICSGARLDNLVHVAHNVVIGMNCMVVAQAGLGGSVIVGDGAWIGFGAHVKEHVTIGEHALIGMGAVVLKDVPANETWAGSPARCLNAKVGVRETM